MTDENARRIGEGPLCSRCLIPTTWNLDTQVWDHTGDYKTSDRSAMRDEHHVTFVAQVGPQWLAVTLTATTNPYLTVPCEGLVKVNEYGTDGSAISASFRFRRDDGSHGAAVQVDRPEWIYRGPGVSRTVLTCPDPAAHAVPPEDRVWRGPSIAAVCTSRVRDHLHGSGFRGVYQQMRVDTDKNQRGRLVTTVRPRSGDLAWHQDEVDRMARALRDGYPDADVVVAEVRDLITIVWPS